MRCRRKPMPPGALSNKPDLPVSGPGQPNGMTTQSSTATACRKIPEPDMS